MDYEDFIIGDRVGRYFGNKIEKATIIDINEGLYLLHFDNKEYHDLLCDEEKIFKLNESINNDLLQILYCSYWEIQKRSDDELIKIRTKEFKVIYEILDFMLNKFTEKIYPETMLVDIFEYLMNNYNYNMWDGVIKRKVE